MPVIAGAGSNSTAEAIELSQHAEKAGADAVLVVTPYYNKPTQEGLYQHFKAINDAVDIPIIIYNIPAALGGRHVGRDHGAAVRAEEHRRRQGRDRQPRARLAAARTRWARISSSSRARTRPRSASWRTAATAASRSTSNVAPRLCAEFQNACLAGDYATALELQDRLMPLHDALFIETNPSPAQVRAVAARQVRRNRAAAAGAGGRQDQGGDPRRHGACRA